MESPKSQRSYLSSGWPCPETSPQKREPSLRCTLDIGEHLTNLSLLVLQEKHRLLCEAHLSTLAHQKNSLPNKRGRGRRGKRGKSREGGTTASHSGLCPFSQVFPFQDPPFLSCTQTSALLEITQSVFFALQILQLCPHHY